MNQRADDREPSPAIGAGPVPGPGATDVAAPPAASGRPDVVATAKIMIVDDEPINCKVTRKFLSLEGYQNFIVLSDPTTAIELIRKEKPDVLLLDIMMPEVSGLDILKTVRAEPGLAQLPVLILTATCDDQTKRRALDLGATDFLPKPVDVNELLPRVRNALTIKAHYDTIRGHAEELEQRVRERTEELTLTRLEVVLCLGRAAEYRDNDTGNHVVRVGRYAGIIARSMGLDDEAVELIEHAAPLHDVGKIAIPDAILLKSGKLTPEEFDVMRGHAPIGKRVLDPLSEREARLWHSHTQLGAKIIGVVGFRLLEVAAKIALTHHERWDGTGYPLGLAGEDIPVEGRITAAADVFDALSSRRPYKEPYPRERCFQIMREARDTHFDPQVLDAMFASTDQIVETQLRYADT